MAAVWVWALALLLLLPGLVLQTPDTRFGVVLAAQCVVVAHAGGALTRVLTDTSVRLVALGFWLFAYVWLGLAPLAMLATDSYPLGYRTGATTALAAVALTELGLLAYSAGSVLAARRTGGRSAVLEPLLSRRIPPLPVLLLCVLALVLAVVLIPQQEGGWHAFFVSRQAVRQSGAASDVTRVMRVWALSVPAFWGLVGLVLLARWAKGDPWLRRIRWALLPLLVTVNVVVNNPISRPRFWAGTVLAVLLFCWPRFNNPRAFRITAGALTVVLLLVFPYADYFRYDKREAVHVVSVTEQLSTNMDYDAFQQMQTGIDAARETGLSPSSALGVALFMVPRSIWADKPDDTAIKLARYAGYKFDNLSAPMWIESYLWGGPPCVIAVFCLMGAAGRRMDDIRERLRAKGAVTLAVPLVPAFAFYQLILLRGSLMAITGPLLMLMTVPLFITVRAARAARSSRRPASAQPPATAGHAPLPG
ncbi:hypothetical protein [Streptomyces sp. V3I7]|uniref:hypothetical protein n=1 Tax=Streptomyces sp. V3I7 TaxID=3042278 RepID=UPI0027D7F29A|nr:hypothetical protein [Streptomyces sp. V3I7]